MRRSRSSPKAEDMIARLKDFASANRSSIRAYLSMIGGSAGRLVISLVYFIAIANTLSISDFGLFATASACGIMLSRLLAFGFVSPLYRIATVKTRLLDLAKALGEQVTVLPGLNEISAGWFEGVPLSDTSGTFLLGPEAWLKGDRRFGIPGSVNGNQFNNAFTEAVQKIYESGDEKPVAISSGLAIMMWTLLNARNGKPSLLTDHPLPNASQVVLTGNPITGWVLQDWDGITNFAIESD